MSYTLHFKGGPRNDQTEQRKSAQNVIQCNDRPGMQGAYCMHTIKGSVVRMVWHDAPRQVESNANS